MSDDTDWFEVGDSPVVRTEVRLRECADGSTDLDIRQSPRDLQTFLDQLADERELTEARGWKDGAVIGRVPDAYYYRSGLAQASKEGDTRYIKNFWNDPDHARLRLKTGSV